MIKFAENLIYQEIFVIGTYIESWFLSNYKYEIINSNLSQYYLNWHIYLFLPLISFNFWSKRTKKELELTISAIV